jgi:hypothetical protein
MYKMGVALRSAGVSSMTQTLTSVAGLHGFSMCDTIAQELRPDRIMLFCSYASSQPHPDADVDRLVGISCQGSPFRQAAYLP